MLVNLSHTLFTSPYQEENEEMGRELSEDRVHKLERQLALAKAYAEDMQAAFQECEDHATALDEEAEKIQEEVCSFKTPCAFSALHHQCMPVSHGAEISLWVLSSDAASCADRYADGLNCTLEDTYSVRISSLHAVQKNRAVKHFVRLQKILCWLLQNFKLRRQMQELETRAPRPPQYGMRGGPRDVNRPYIPHNSRPPFHNNSPPMSRPYTRRPVDSALPPNKRSMAPPDRRDEGDRFSSRPRAR